MFKSHALQHMLCIVRLQLFTSRKPNGLTLL